MSMTWGAPTTHRYIFIGGKWIRDRRQRNRSPHPPAIVVPVDRIAEMRARRVVNTQLKERNMTYL